MRGFWEQTVETPSHLILKECNNNNFYNTYKKGDTEKKNSKKTKILPFVLLPEVAGEGNKQPSGERSETRSQPHPEFHALARQCFLFGQGHTSHTQLGLTPHIQNVLRMNIHNEWQWIG